jgi:hypothetical protein
MLAHRIVFAAVASIPRGCAGVFLALGLWSLLGAAYALHSRYHIVPLGTALSLCAHLNMALMMIVSASFVVADAGTNTVVNELLLILSIVQSVVVAAQGVWSLGLLAFDRWATMRAVPSKACASPTIGGTVLSIVDTSTRAINLPLPRSDACARLLEQERDELLSSLAAELILIGYTEQRCSDGSKVAANLQAAVRIAALNTLLGCESSLELPT